MAREASALSALGLLLLSLPAGASAQTRETPSLGGFVSVGAGLVQPTDFNLVGTVSDEVDRNEFASAYRGTRSPIFDIGGGVLLRRRFAIGAAVSRHVSTQPGTLTVTLTHPKVHPALTAQTESEPLDRTERAVHLQAGYLVPVGSRWSLMLFGGPSHVSVRHDLIADLDFEEDFNSVAGQWSILGPVVEVGEAKASAWGYHVGTDVSYRLFSLLEVGALVRYTRATVDLESPIQSRISDRRVTEGVTAGGLEMTGGVRFRFAKATRGGASSGRRAGGWEVEMHAGGAFGNNPGSTTALPGVGVPFTTFDGFPSRTVASWYFGDGAEVFSQNSATRGQGARISPLDPAFATSSVKTKAAGAFGVRVGRPLTPRLTAEFSLDVANGSMALTDVASATIESSRSSFQTGFETLLGSSNAITDQASRIVTSTSTIEDAAGAQIIATGALKINLLRGRRFTPYVTVGGGVLSQTGDLPKVTLVGDYQFTSATNKPFRQTDTVDFRFTSRRAPVMLLGGGFTQALSARSGLRADFRVHLGPDKAKVLLNANAVTIPGVSMSTFKFDGTPAIQIDTTGERFSTLSTPLFDQDFEVAAGRGIRTLGSVTLGYFWQF